MVANSNSNNKTKQPAAKKLGKEEKSVDETVRTGIFFIKLSFLIELKAFAHFTEIKTLF